MSSPQTAASPPNAPLRYSPEVERPEPDEAETLKGLIETLRSISETTFKDYGHAVRSVHAKAHGLIRGEMQVLDNLPVVLAQGLFSKSGTYPVVMRLSTVPGDILDDSVSLPRGLGLKVIGVEGARLPGSEGSTTQDFVMGDAPAFGAPNPKAFLGNLKLVAKTTDAPQILKKALSAALRGAEAVVEAFGSESGLLKDLGGHPETHILGETFYSRAPLRYGDYIAKIAVVPVSPELAALRNAPLNVNGKPNGLREAVIAFFAEHAAEWELRVQLCTDLDTMPVENAAKVWPEDKSPYVAVARIRAPRQEAWSEARVAGIDDGLSFSPWHGLAAHQPLGGIMRSRRATYEMSAQFRAEHNHVPVKEPAGAADLPA